VDGTDAGNVLYGDLNQDGQVSSTDLVAMKRYLLKNFELSGVGLEAADLNSDGKVNSTDLVALKRFC